MWRALLALFLLILQVPGGSPGSAGFAVFANFNARSGGAVIPANWQGANDMHHLDSPSTTTLTGAGVNVSRVVASLAQIWAGCPGSCTANYASAIDGQSDLASSGGYSLEVYIDLTPPDLGASSCTPPSNNTTWATRAAALIAHLDARHSGLVKLWAVWNEPDLTANLCPGSGTNLAAYLPIYAAAAPAMIAQVTADGSTALVGGPELGSAGTNAAAWFANTSTGLLGNSGTAPYVQFVSYHSYLGGCTSTWAACLSALQSASTGQAALYTSIDALVRAGSQPSASTTPIFITETNDSSAFSADPIRNDATNGPLWSGISTIGWLNSIASGATTIPQGVWYYDAACTSTPTYFGLFGSSAGSACTPLNPYPQFYLYDLVNSSSFLNLSAGGHLATSITPASTLSGVSSAAFYTSSGDSVLWVNPTATAYAGVTIAVLNAGSVSGTCTAYLLNSSNPTIATSTPTCLHVGSGYYALVTMPAYSSGAVTVQ